jgi:hypothetical protein
LSKPTKKIGKKEEVLSVSDKKANELHMRTKCPEQHGNLLGDEDH